MKTAKHIYAILGIITVLTAIGISAPAAKVKAAPPGGPTNVLVTNPIGNPVNVRDAKSATRQYVQLYQLVNIPDGQIAATFNLYTVPAGKRLFVTDSSVFVHLPGTEKPVLVRIRALVNGFYQVNRAITSHEQGATASGNTFCGSLDGGTLTFEAGHTVNFLAQRLGNNGTGTFDATLHGYLEDAN